MSKAILAIMQNGQELIYNTTMNILLRTLLAVVLCMTTREAFAWNSQGKVKIDGIYYVWHKSYVYDENHHATKDYFAVVTYKDRYKRTPEYSGDIVIPEAIHFEGERYEVTFVDNDAFSDCIDLRSIILPNSINFINNCAFKGCTGLTYVYIPPKAKIEEDAFKDCPNLHFYQHPNDAKISVSMSIIDTLKAESIFQEMRPTLMEAFQKGTDKKERCHELCSMVGKKVKGEYDTGLLCQAYIYCRYNNTVDPSFRMALGFDSDEVIKNIRKGKITGQLQKCLSYYHEYLTDSLKKKQDKIERGWSGMSKSALPYKQITIPMPNSFYRGYRYLNNDDLDSMDIYMQQKGWEFLNTKNRKYRSESYPEEVKYLVYDASPEYRVTYSGNNIKEVYNKDGKLIYVPYLTREINAAELKDVHRLVYFKDYINNKYDILSQPKQTQEYLKLILCRDNGFKETASDALGSLFASAFASYVAKNTLSPEDAHKVQNQAKEYAVNQTLKYSDNIGIRYIEQLEKDHAEEFGYVYMIERLSNVSFQVIYLNKQTLEPSYCAVITYKTGEKPYTSTFSTKLVNIPDNIPPVIKE